MVKWIRLPLADDRLFMFLLLFEELDEIGIEFAIYDSWFVSLYCSEEL